MSRTLPHRADFTQLRHQAKDLMRAHERGDAAACVALRRLRRFASADDAQVLSMPLALHEAQYALAMEYGFTSWNAMKRHLEANGSASNSGVRRENGRVWIDGVPALRWGESGECSFAGALSAALTVTDRPVAYSELMGASGLAFRVRWWRRFDEPNWCPSSPVGEFSEEILTVTDAIGWRVRQQSRMGETEYDMSAFAGEIRDSIDLGRPVVGYGDADLNVAVCYGYESSGDAMTFLWNAYNRDAHAVPAAKVGPWLLFLNEPIEPLEARAMLKQALTTPNWRRRRLESWRPQPGQDAAYLYGQEALRQWRQDIAQADGFSPEQQRTLFFVSWWCIDCLVDARRSAVTYLTRHLDVVDAEARGHLGRAAEAYGRLAQSVAHESFEEHRAFLGPWTGRKFEDWSADVRSREADLLAEVASLDASAAAEIDKALVAMG